MTGFINAVLSRALYIVVQGWAYLLTGLIGVRAYTQKKKWWIIIGSILIGTILAGLTYWFLHHLIKGLWVGYFQDPWLGWKLLMISLIPLLLICAGFGALNLILRIFIFTAQIAKLVSVDASIWALKKLWEIGIWPFKFSLKVIAFTLAGLYTIIGGDVAYIEKILGLLNGTQSSSAESSEWGGLMSKLKELETALQKTARKATLFFKHTFAGVITASLLILVFGGQHDPNTLTSFLSDYGAGYALLVLIILLFSKLWLDEYESSKKRKERAVWRYVAWTAGFVLFIGLLNQVGVASYLNKDAFRYVKAGIVKCGTNHQVEAARKQIALQQQNQLLISLQSERLIIDTVITFHALTAKPTTGRWASDTAITVSGKKIWLPLNSNKTLVETPRVLHGKVFFLGDFQFNNQLFSVVTPPDKTGQVVPELLFVVAAKKLSVPYLLADNQSKSPTTGHVTRLPKPYYPQGGGP